MAKENHSNKRVSYFFDQNIGNFHFGEKHPMKPHRLLIAHELIVNYGLYKKMNVFLPQKASVSDMIKFHNQDYIAYLKAVNERKPSNEIRNLNERFFVGREKDCPLFEGVYSLSAIASGASIAAAIQLNKQNADICINWAGGLHHAKKSSASGFCYVNDIVLAILELLKFHRRVLYVDIDIHHGDGVQEAFYLTDRVMTVSFHRYGSFFPGSGSINEIGDGAGKYYSINVPLNSGMNDELYRELFCPIMTKVMQVYRPSCVVLQCGADSLVGDRLGDFNLTLKGHGECVEFFKRLDIPLLLLGGGGYTVKNVSRCWTYETSIALGVDLPNDLPHNDYFDTFHPDYKLHFEPNQALENKNTLADIHDNIERVFENLRNIQAAPSVPLIKIPSPFPDYFAEANFIRSDDT